MLSVYCNINSHKNASEFYIMGLNEGIEGKENVTATNASYNS
jgi:hypothetical protein